MELSPIAAFIAVLVGAFAGGLLGETTALPVTAAGKVILRQALAERRQDDPALAGAATSAET